MLREKLNSTFTFLSVISSVFLSGVAIFNLRCNDMKTLSHYPRKEKKKFNISNKKHNKYKKSCLQTFFLIIPY